jgi:hypothetical protein
MISSEVQRTLVKSPPELWAEISDPESLARHLGEFGEIRITRVQPEQKVEWEADEASGAVVIKPSGWGTKVKLTATRELAQPEPVDESSVGSGDEPDDEQLGASAPEQSVDEPAEGPERERDAAATAPAHEPQDITELGDRLEVDADDAPVLDRASELEQPSDSGPPSDAREAVEQNEEANAHTEAEPDAEPVTQPEPEPRRSFFARLFGRRRPRTEEPGLVELPGPASQPIANEPIDDESLSAGLEILERDVADEPAREHDAPPRASADDPTESLAQPSGELAPETEAPAAAQTIETHEDSADRSEQQAASDDAATLAKLAEELAAEEVTAVLTGVLDRLGAAHHRPFSRA